MQQGVQMSTIANIQHCWELLANNVVSNTMHRALEGIKFT